jgi:Bacterial SH3 domain
MKWILTPALLGCLSVAYAADSYFAAPPGKKAHLSAVKPARAATPAVKRPTAKTKTTSTSKQHPVSVGKPVKTGSKHPEAQKTIARPAISVAKVPTRMVANTGLLIGTDITVRTSASHQAKIVRTATSQDLIMIDSVTGRKESMPGTTDRCHEYPWVRVRFADNTTGWVSGRSVFRLMAADKKLMQDAAKEVVFEGNRYKIGLCHNYFIGAADKNGLTFCAENDIYPIVLYSSDLKKVHLVELTGVKSGEFKYMMLHDHDFQTDEIKQIEVNGQQLKVTMDITFPERCERWEMVIRRVGDGFQAEPALVTKAKPCEGTFPQPDEEEEI